jgi:uncharacterized protein YjbI with pentapeptide repeats
VCVVMVFFILPLLSSFALSAVRDPFASEFLARFVRATKIMPGEPSPESVRDVAAERAVKRLHLYILHYTDPLVPSFMKNDLDISAVDLTGMRLTSISLPGANFSYSKFGGTDLRGSMLEGASFYGSKISDGADFRGANLRYAQFDSALINSATFADAKLRRAVFDGAQLCDTDFSGADLRTAAFRQTMFGHHFAKHFARTAWWLAIGWDSDQLKELAKLESASLENSDVFRSELNDLRNAIAKASGGSYQRALALNDMAWTLATYGLKLGGAGAGAASRESVCSRNAGIPESAVGAAWQAVCIVEALNQTTVASAATFEETNFRDTLGYILLQLAAPDDQAQLAEATAQLSLAMERGQLQSLGGEFLFRHAVGQYASGKKEEAFRTLRRAMEELRYVPSHELVRLKHLITGELEGWIYRQISFRRPPPRSGQDSACGGSTGATVVKDN